MAEIETDILVAGGGIAGLTVAARLAAEGFRVVAVDPRPTGQMPEDEGADRRTTAFLMPAVETFRRAGAWPRLVAEATALNGMRIVSAAGGTGLGPRGTSRAQGPKPRAEALFDAGELGDAPFGYNVVNTAARTALAAALAERAHARAIEGRRVMAARRRLSGAMAELDDGTWIAARLIVAADGRDSPLVRAARIPVRRWQYGQRALVFPVTHADPHANLSTEFHRPGGPLVLVPLPDIEGRPASSVVWLNRTPRAHALAAMDDGDLAAALTAETMGRFGPLTVAGPRAEWPIVSQLAARLTAERLALVGEPAHVVPPTGAQGANLSVADAETLTEVLAAARAAGEDIGSPAVLARYQRRRWPEIAARVAGIDTLNRAVDSASPAVIAARSLGIDLMDRIAPLRRLTMRAGLGGTTLAEAAEGVLAPLRRAAAASARHGFARKP